MGAGVPKIVIGDSNLILGSCHIAHDYKVGNNNIFANNTLLAGHVVVEDYAHTAGAIVVSQFCCVGSFSFIGDGSVVSQDVPKYMMVAGERAELRGLNLEGLRRCGFSITEVIGDDNLIMGSCHNAHDYKVGNNNIFANNTLLASHVVVECHLSRLQHPRCAFVYGSLSFSDKISCGLALYILESYESSYRI